MKVKTILVSQPEPKVENSPYSRLIEKEKIKVRITSYNVCYTKLLRPNYPWMAIVFGYPVMGVWFWCTDQSMVQSVLGAKNLRQGELGANFTGWLKFLDVALFIIPGLACFGLFPNLSVV